MNEMLSGGIEQIEAKQGGETHYHTHKHKYKNEESEGVPIMAQGLDLQEIGSGPARDSGVCSICGA